MKLWNAGITTKPAEIVRCATKEQVGAAILAARQRGLALSVAGGGHDWAGRAVREGGLVIDLSPMNRVGVTADVAHAGGGATSLDVMETAVTAGQTVVTGTVGSVGMAGLALGGGYGPQLGSAGPACDLIVGAEVVLADGRVVFADAEHEPDLFWALRGGGGNFGVVTDLRLRLRPFATALAGSVLFPWDRAGSVLRGWAALVPGVPDELTVHIASLGLPDGTRVLALSPTWVGGAAQGERWVGDIGKLGTTISSQVARIPLTEQLVATERLFAADGRSWYLRTRSLPALTDPVIDLLVEAGDSAVGADDAFAMHHFHGQATRVAPEATAFAERHEHFMLELVAGWRDGDPQPHREWARRIWRDAAAHALPGGYPNVLGPDDHDQIARAWGTNAERLTRVKQKYDPDGVFTGIPLPS
ncbi:FAD-binding oxidoreductase [Kineosporia sp. J2-2]|uniref:FAD-binding oxidoreductase n=1 Tax=Kineosporia corallincola TaxID=2835133 RepID=A0ABS5THZ2_9ACTN|nr:FAD-binding oxidoreductase [Kineosporia corallincola]MBT0770665.1 FAD-binding oxidoreductase [Kineosporia corallincola]